MPETLISQEILALTLSQTVKNGIIYPCHDLVNQPAVENVYCKKSFHYGIIGTLSQYRQHCGFMVKPGPKEISMAVQRRGKAMKKLYHILRIVLWSTVGVFIGTSIYTWHDYRTRPGLYAMQSAPWYLRIQVNAVYSVVTVAVILFLMWIIRKNQKMGH